MRLMTRKKGMMHFNLFKKIIDEIATENISEKVDFHVMGEPLLYKHLIPAINYVNKKNLKLRLITNGGPLTEDLSQRLSKLNFHQIVLSLQTPDEQSFKLRGSNMSFQKYIDNIIQFIRIMHENKSKTKITLDFLNTTSYKFLNLPFEVSILNSKKAMKKTLKKWIRLVYSIKSLDFEEKKIDRQLEKIKLSRWTLIEVAPNFNIVIPLLYDWGNAFSKKKIFPTKIGSCVGLTEMFGILWNGDLVFCCEDYNGFTKVDNVTNTSIMGILNSKKVLNATKGFKRFRVVHPYCQRCLGGKSRIHSIFKSIGSIIFVNFMNRRNKISLLT
jgi:sulfatase maturation enzyme AslB (radical SAM superfamily)